MYYYEYMHNTYIIIQFNMVICHQLGIYQGPIDFSRSWIYASFVYIKDNRHMNKINWYYRNAV